MRAVRYKTKLLGVFKKNDGNDIPCAINCFDPLRREDCGEDQVNKSYSSKKPSSFTAFCGPPFVLFDPLVFWPSFPTKRWFYLSS